MVFTIDFKNKVRNHLIPGVQAFYRRFGRFAIIMTMPTSYLVS